MRSLLLALIGTTLALILAFAVSWLIYMPNADERGVWRSEAGGMILDIGRTSAKTYRETSVSCIHDLTFPAHMKVIELVEGAWIEAVDGQLALHLDGSVEPTLFTRIDALPATCREPWPDTATAREVFDVVWAAMDENYAFFHLYGVDWDERRALAPDPDADLTDAELFALLQTLLAGLDDGHIQLGAGEQGYFSPSVPPDWFPEGAPFTREGLSEIARAANGIPLTRHTEAPIDYVLRDDGIGYAMIRAMDVKQPLGVLSETAMARVFANVAETLEPAEVIILDLRYNPGGSDSVSLGVASHFTDAPLTAFTKTSRLDAGQTAPFTATLQPYDDTPLTQPVIVLTSRLTGSAAEILTMTLRNLPQVTIMGEPTGGGLSDILGFVLPNGWLFGLSNQTYLTADGELFEAIGIPPDIPFEITADPLLAGEDPLLEAAIAHARSLR